MSITSKIIDNSITRIIGHVDRNFRVDQGYRTSDRQMESWMTPKDKPIHLQEVSELLLSKLNENRDIPIKIRIINYPQTRVYGSTPPCEDRHYFCLGGHDLFYLCVERDGIHCMNPPFNFKITSIDDNWESIYSNLKIIFTKRKRDLEEKIYKNCDTLALESDFLSHLG